MITLRDCMGCTEDYLNTRSGCPSRDTAKMVERVRVHTTALRTESDVVERNEPESVPECKNEPGYSYLLPYP